MGEGLDRNLIESQKNNDDENTVGTLLILDDLMLESTTDPYIMTIFTAGRHYGISGTILVWHNLFPKGKNSRLISLNVTAFWLMRSPRISSQVGTLGTELGIRKRLIDAYRHATEGVPYSYLLVDFTDRSNPKAWEYPLKHMEIEK